LIRDGSSERHARQQMLELAAQDPKRERLIGGRHVLTQAEIAEILRPGGGLEEMWECFELLRRFRLFGLPFAGGWADQPAVVVDVLETLLLEESATVSASASTASAR